MNKYYIRFNKSRGEPGRGSMDHVWRIFENEQKEYLVKHFRIDVKSHDETTGDGRGNDDWNICCEGYIKFDRETSTAIITAKK